MQAPKVNIGNLQRELKQANKALYRVKACMGALKRNWLDIVEIKEAIDKDDLIYAGGLWNDLSYQDQMDLCLASTKGGCFTVAEYKIIKEAWTLTHEKAGI